MMPWYRRLFGPTDEQLLQTIACSPDYYPYELLLSQRTPGVSFVQAGRDIYRQSSFLDHRMLRNPGAKKTECGLEELLGHYRNCASGRVAFIFHIAYCCSTLLARYLELLPGSFVLKEPFILTQLAEMNRSSQVREDLARLCAQLLARTYDPAAMAVVKLADQCNAVAGALMASSGFQRSVFIGLELRSFLLSGLKTDQRRAWVRRRAELAAIDIAPSPLAQIDPKGLGDGEACAFLWLTNGVLLQKLLKNVGSDGVLIIDGEEISDKPEETVRAVAAWFRLASSDSELRAVLNDEASGHYSKNPGQAFTREDRRAELAAIYSELGNEVETTMKWASARAADLGLDPYSGRMLADQRP
jgi:hypothetical protein